MIGTRPLLAAIAAGAVLGAVVAPEAHADPVDNYTVVEATIICQALTVQPTLTTVTTLFSAIIRDTGFSVEDTARVVTDSVRVWCPGNQHVLDRFVDVYGSHHAGYVA